MENYQGDLENDCQIIRNYLAKSNGISIDDLHKTIDLGISLENLQHILNIWCKEWNTFFIFGRIYTKNNKWYWIDCNHPFSRKQKLEQLI